MNQQQIIFLTSFGIDFSQITNVFALIGVIFLILTLGVPRIKNTIYQYLMMIGGFAICGIAFYSHYCETQIKEREKNGTEQKVCEEKIINLEEKAENCSVEKDTLKKEIDIVKKQKEILDKDLVLKNEKIKTLRSENKKLLGKVQEQEGQYNFSYKEGYCVVVKDGKYGFKDKHNHIVIACQFLSAAQFSNSRAGVKGKNQKWGFIDYSGTIVIPCEYDEIKRFEKDGLAIVEKNGKMYKIDKLGKWKKNLPDLKSNRLVMR
jgi:WG containing repeat